MSKRGTSDEKGVDAKGTERSEGKEKRKRRKTYGLYSELMDSVNDGVDAEACVSDDDDPDDLLEKSKDRTLVTVNAHANSKDLFTQILGDSSSVAELENRISTYTASQWAIHAEQLFRHTVDTTSTGEDLLLYVQSMHHLFCYPFKDEYAVVDRIKAVYPHVTTMKEQRDRMKQAFGKVELELIRRGLCDEQSKVGREIHRLCKEIAFGMKFAFESLVLTRMLQKGTDKSIRSMLEDMTPEALFKEIDLVNLKPHQQLIHWYQQKLFQLGYRKEKECLYKPKYNEAGEFTYSYEYVQDMIEFVFTSLFPLQENAYWYDCLTQRAGTAKHCAEILSNQKSEWIPDLERNYNIHAFINGLYVLAQDKFYWYRKIEGKLWVGMLTGNITAIKYHDIVFDEVGMYEDMMTNKQFTPIAIAMPRIRSIFDTQEFTNDERLWILVFLGRMLHPLGKQDNWGVFPYFLGLAGTGKSTLLRLLASLLESRDVGYLNNALQKTFALEGIYDKLIYMCMDVDENFQLDQVTFQSMVVGEEVSVLRKFKRPITLVWQSHGAFAGNKLPKWTDNGGSLSRRIVVIEFLVPIGKTDPNLFENCLTERARFLKVINAAYLMHVEKYKNKGIKAELPDKFKLSEQRALMELNILLSFMKDCCDIDPEPVPRKKTYIQTMSDFKKAFKVYCSRNNLQHQVMAYTFYSGPFGKHQLNVVTPVNAQTDPFKQSSQYIIGIKLKASALDMISGS